MTYFGVAFFPTDYSIQPIPLARALEERGLDSLYVTEHTHIPASRKSPWPGGPDLPKEYWHTLDPFVALGAAAAVTERLRLGTGICLVVERDPIQLAKEVASLDLISNGRVILGVGAGWNREEMENHGARFDKRWAIVREKVLAMKAIWTEDEPEFHGEFVDFDPIWSWPKPVQKGGPKVLVGAQSRFTWNRVAEWGDGWMPIGMRGGIEEGMKSLRNVCQESGRDFENLEKAIFAPTPELDHCEKLIECGFTDLAFSLPSVPEDEALPILDRYAELAAQLR
ncbi:MAG: LLM class F420-dependent oxidoreductase [Deltaproteobacteria bacterium]|nr:LLM class F420-dependent oxidoreductase [Deltaproteobacteria bacterium]